MHVIQTAAWFPPFHTGGTEVYLEGLIDELRNRGIKSTVIVPRNSKASERYRRGQTSVETYSVAETPSRGEMRHDWPHQGYDEFCTQIASYPGSIYHQHSWTRGCGPHHLRAAREAGLRTVITVHVAGNVCLRGSMLKFGSVECDGRVDEQTCGACWAHSKGMPKVLAGAIARLPRSLTERVLSVEGGRVTTALGARSVGSRRLTQLHGMFDDADRVVAVCGWLYSALSKNGAPLSKLVLVRQGVPTAYQKAAQNVHSGASSSRGKPLRLLFLGRWDAAKGISIIVRAIRAIPQLAGVRLSIYAASSGADTGSYEDEVRALAKHDPRIAIEPPVSRDGLADVMAKHDVLLVPSLILETGPLVVLEAQAAGLFVLGSRLGGIAELVEDGPSGRLIQAGDVVAWTQAIAQLVEAHAHGSLMKSVRSVRTMGEVADDMAEIYRSL